MLPLLTLDRLCARLPDGASLFEDVSFSIDAGLTGLVGRNGAGKTTLLRLIAEDIAPAAGSISRRGRIGWLQQSPSSQGDVAALMGVAELLARLARIIRGEAAEDDLELADWGLEARLEAALAELGLGGLPLETPAVSLSGGERTRAALAGVLAAEPDLLLLDEPTNNLDREGRAWVGAVLSRWKGAALIASHDRELLRRMHRIVELGPLGAQSYGGDYDLFVERKAAQSAAALRALEEAEQEAVRVRRAAQAARERQDRSQSVGARLGASGSMPKMAAHAQAQRAQSTSARGEKLAQRQAQAADEALTAAAARVPRGDALRFALPSTGLPAGKSVLVVEAMSFAWPEAGPSPARRLGPLRLSLTGPQRLAIGGRNGSGKTTLIRLILGDLTPSEGSVRLGVPAAALDQQAAVLRPDETLLDAFARLNPEASAQLARSALARFLFRGETVRRRVGSLSGGERLRAALACILSGSQAPQLLILDEPTNHLDLESIAAIETALAEFDGALILVSHDEDFLAAVGVTQRLELGA